jgi:CDP-paratose 2-epimerase
MRRFIEFPRVGEVYNLGGGRANSTSILEAFDMIESISGKPMRYQYLEANREGDHICYMSNLQKIKAHYPGWEITKDLRTTFAEIHQSWMTRI